MLILKLLCGLIFGFVLPGYFLAKILRRPGCLVSSFIFSIIILYETVFLFQLIGIRICFVSVISSLVLISIILGISSMYVAAADQEPEHPAKFSGWSRTDIVIWGLIALIGIIFVLRSFLQPFNYGDTEFRWNFLALKMLQIGNLNFYPPCSANDFNIYFYVDGIPPLVSTAYFWLYSSFGKPDPALSGILVSAQFFFLLFLCFKIGTRLFGSEKAGFFSVVVLCSSTLFFYSLVIGQETGFTALSVAATLYYLTDTKNNYSSLISAGFATALGALSREYGCCFLLCGIIICAWRGVPAKKILTYISVVLILAAPWYLRTWLRTGNPFYSISSLGGVFPVNEVFCGIFDVYSKYFGFSCKPGEKIYFLLTSLAFTAPLQVLIGLAAGIYFFRKHGFLIVSSVILAGLWAYSLGKTTGGIFYSMRVLSPLLFLLSLSAGGLIAQKQAVLNKYNILSGLLSLFCIIGGIQSLLVPYNVWKLPPRDWSYAAFHPMDNVGSKVLGFVYDLPENSRILSTSPFFHAELSENQYKNISIVPVWSPEVRFMFDANTDYTAASQRLSICGIGFILYEPKSHDSIFLEKFPIFKECIKNAEVIKENDSCVLYKIKDK